MVEHERPGQQLVVRDLVALDRVPGARDLVHQPAEARAGNQDLDVASASASASASALRRRGRGREVGRERGEHGRVACGSLGRAGGRPVPVELAERAAGFVEVCCRGGWRMSWLAETEGFEARLVDGFGQVGVCVDRGVDGVQGREHVERRLGEEGPVG